MLLQLCLEGDDEIAQHLPALSHQTLPGEIASQTGFETAESLFG